MVLQDFVQITSNAGRTIRWNFSQQREVGQFANGDWWVQGPVTITSITPFVYTPASEGAPERWQSGSMLNPDPLTGGNGRLQGYDDTMYDGFSGTYWSEALCENLLLPKVYPAGSSIVSTVSNSAARALPQLYFSGCLTVVATIPAVGSFRPPYCPGTVTEKAPQWVLGDMDLAKLTTEFSWSEYMEPERPYAQTLQRVSGFVIDHARGWLSRYALAEELTGGYGRDYAGRLGNAIMGLISDLGTSQKRDLAVQLVQKGIDSYYLLKRGHSWPADGGHMPGRKFPILLAGHLLDNQDMLDIGRDYLGPTDTFGEDGQTFFVEETSPGVYNSGFGGYGPADVGVAEWGFRHWANASQDNRLWAADSYRRCCTGNIFIAPALASLSLGLRSDWNHEPFFDYMDRFMDTMPIDPDTGATYPSWQRSYEPPHEDIWDGYRTGIEGSGGLIVSLGSVRIHNDTAYVRQVMSRCVVPALQGELPDTARRIVTDAGDWVAWRPLQTENGDPATWGDGSYKYAECWVPATLTAGEMKVVGLVINQAIAPPAFALHQAVAAQVGSFLTGGAANDWSWRCDVAPGTGRSAQRNIFDHGVVTTEVDNENCKRIKWFVRSADGRIAWVHYHEFYRGVPISKFWSLPIFTTDQSPDFTDWVAGGFSVIGNGCFPQVEDFFKFSNPFGGAFSSWSRNWGGTGPVGDGQSPGAAIGTLLYLDPTTLSGSSIETTTTQAYSTGNLSEEAVSTRWAQTETFGPHGYVPPLPDNFTSEAEAITASVVLARSIRDNLPGNLHPDLFFLENRLQSREVPSGTGAQADHAISRFHFITTLGVPTGLHVVRRAVNQEWCRPTFLLETGNVAGTSDGDIVSVDNHPLLGIWDGRPFETVLLGKPSRNVPADAIRTSNNGSVTLPISERTTSFTAVVYNHYRCVPTAPMTCTLPASGPAWVIVENRSDFNISVVPSGGLTLLGGAGPVNVGARRAIRFNLDGGASNWTTSEGMERWKGYDRQHHSIHTVTHHFLLTGDPMTGRQIDHHREQLRGTLRDIPYLNAGGNFTIATYEQDRADGRCMLSAAWIESMSPQAAFRTAVNSRLDTSLTAGLFFTPEFGLGSELATLGFPFIGETLAAGHDIRNLNFDGSSLGVGPAGEGRFSATVWQRGIFTAGLFGWHRVSGNARARELVKIYSYTDVEHFWFNDTQTANGGFGNQGPGFFMHYWAVRFNSPGSVAGFMPLPQDLPPQAEYNEPGGIGFSYGPRQADNAALFRIVEDGLDWFHAAPLIAREIMIEDGEASGTLWDKSNDILRSSMQTYYTGTGATNTWTIGGVQNWIMVARDPLNQNYGGGGGATQTVDLPGIDSAPEFGDLQAEVNNAQTPRGGGVIIIRGRR